MYRKLLTKPIYTFERRRPYPMRQKVFALRPLQVDPSSPQQLVVLGTPNTFADAGWAAYSSLLQLPVPMGLCLAVDGEVPAEDVARMQRLFPGVIIKQSGAFAEEFKDQEAIYAFAQRHPLGRKLATLLSVQKEKGLIYSDSDVLAFNSMPEVTRAMETNQPCYLGESGGLNPDPKLLDKVKRLNVQFAPELNSGFLYMPRGSADIALANELLADDGYDLKSWFSEQTLLAALMGHMGGTLLPTSKYVVSNDRQFFFEQDVDYSKIALRHFTTPTRHLMYSKGINRIWRQARAGR